VTEQQHNSDQAPATETNETAEQQAASTQSAETTGANGAADDTPRPTPASMPTPASIPTPAQITPKLAHPGPAAPATAPAATTSPLTPAADTAAAAVDPAEAAAAAEFGRVGEDGTVYVREPTGERVVGQFPDVSAEDALALYVRRYLDLKTQIGLFADRLEQLGAGDLDATEARLEEELREPDVVGDIDALRRQLDDLAQRARQRREQLALEREEAKERALTERTAIVEKVEEIAATDPARMQWRAQGQRIRSLLEEWKHAQKSGPRIERHTEDKLWKRFAAARSSFDRSRRQFFAELDKKHAEAKRVKEGLIERAEKLSYSTEWGPTTIAYRELMEEWKAAGRAARKEDDALWARFRAAQDIFFQARNEQNAQIDAEYQQNLKVKEQLLTEAEGLLPVREPKKAKAALRDIQERWEAAGKVPRADLKRVEGRMRAVENAVRAADEHEWERTNPRVRARAEGAAAQLEDAIAGLQEDLAKAQSSGDSAKIARAEEALAARRAWLEQVQRAAQDTR